MLKRLLRSVAFVFLIGCGVMVIFLGRQSSVSPAKSSHRATSSAQQRARAFAVESASPATQAVSSRARLLEFVAPGNAAALNEQLPAPAAGIHYARVNPALFYGKRSPFWGKPGVARIEIPLPDFGVANVVINESELLAPDRFISRGIIEGRPRSRVLFAWNEGFLHASIEDDELGSFVVRTATTELAQVYRVDPALMPRCGGERRQPKTAALLHRQGEAPLLPADLAPATPATQNPQRADVHVMMLYTPDVLNTMSGAARAAALQSAFDLAIARVNQAFEASLITARVRLVHVAETKYDATTSTPAHVQDDALTALAAKDDGKMDEIHALRDRVGADVVCLVLNRTDTASSGLSFVLDDPNDPWSAEYAFSVIEYFSVAGTNVVAHELGHVLGCTHDRENTSTGPGAFSFSYGYRFVGADGVQYHDIMSYPPGKELSYFSNPDIVVSAPVNARIGIPPGQPGESNTALTIERTAFATSRYRLQTQGPSAGSLINVATRAFVGTGENVMIAGFVVEGSRPKRMLVRAAGPALRALGVTDVLTDPLLHVFANGVSVAHNDNWETPTADNAASAAQLVALSDQVRALPFSTGSADAAVLVTLPPGAYTAVLEGRTATTGAGLVAAYDVERDTAKIINLATRAFAARDGKEMYGDFVVEGVAGTTKRVLIRVLGPTLARAPFRLTGTLEDPEIEIRNAAGELLIKNDDWSTGAEGGAGTENDFHPLVQLYSEQQIFAAGLAPANRREPCVLVDLPPGSYTVVVRPYEFPGSSDSPPEPAVPGVGIIEVYEVNR